MVTRKNGNPTASTIELDGKQLVRWTRDTQSIDYDTGTFGINVLHPIGEGVLSSILDSREIPVGGSVSRTDGWLFCSKSKLSGRKLDCFEAYRIDFPINADRESIRRIESFGNALLQMFGETAANSADMGRVSGSRRVHGKPDALFLLNSPQEFASGHAVQGDPSLTSLAESFRLSALAREAIDSEYEMWIDALSAHISDARKQELKEIEWQHDFANRMLREHLFLDNGYQVEAEIRLIAPISAFSLAVDDRQKGTNLSNLPALVVLKLRDAQGRVLDLQDVGSGVSFVLPILAQGYANAQTFMEQPELHLHPALQSALGDIFIELACLKRCLVIESHSEHVLLRVLRRIRDTSQEKPGDVPLSVEG